MRRPIHPFKEEILYAIGNCCLGLLLVAESQTGLCAVLIGDEADFLKTELTIRFPNTFVVQKDKIASLTLVTQLIEKEADYFHFPLDERGSPFQKTVWQAIREIPPGKTVSYTELAKKIGSPKAIRAVAGACAANSLAIVTPCHRVVRSDGSLAGYRWGIERKRTLLEIEQKRSFST
ncbi:methylated-DNA--[protein]-cysteine S-methyltransferase [Parachlamydia sp. AcF125]|uniref:methylated-DNA--[protein]-cysteine S-methyltransferase n=1 Tax=Parachlamydia sp. AcF125 TaxID=2795736 RepID=UPI001BCA58C1|nr:methylated-DNA--[protein]-cysteine S-methyltransferase [Parachlamydia sp. AcF125]MBS4168652.1 Bifunctional transcriptional activator/DNA repair enzyme Ada [Parachlamydia sp. AcF125]